MHRSLRQEDDHWHGYPLYELMYLYNYVDDYWLYFIHNSAAANNHDNHRQFVDRLARREYIAIVIYCSLFVALIGAYDSSHFWAISLVYRAYILFIQSAFSVILSPLWCDLFYCFVLRLRNKFHGEQEEDSQEASERQERIVTKSILKYRKVNCLTLVHFVDSSAWCTVIVD